MCGNKSRSEEVRNFKVLTSKQIYKYVQNFFLFQNIKFHLDKSINGLEGGGSMIF
jgi:hypothetical protein